ncbi:ferric reductase-like transmembrane domain-containing protein [Streptomyces sp. NPDC048606]|uniref:ferric reductase-like transmembrane domain-containing protein n=1 Tax=Streptomyces sp. NPDC048606 TaxID=3154726 RepID=UPI0034462700
MAQPATSTADPATDPAPGTATTPAPAAVTAPAPAPAPAAPVRKGPPHTPAPGLRAVSAGLLVVALLLSAGALVGGAVQEFLDEMAGVFALVSLSLSVMLGLATVFRDVLTPGRRQLAQTLHRAAGLIGVGFLLVHIGVKVAGERIAATDALLGTGDLLVDLGTLAAQLFVLALVTGLWRGVFATRRWIRPFRILHGLAYAAWLAGLVHGLGAGRAPAPWVLVSYGLCVAATAAALGHRWTRSRRGR